MSGRQRISGGVRRSRVLPVVVTLGLLGATLLSSSPASGVAGFGDVDDDRFYTHPVQWMVDNHITNGISATCFGPEEFVTRGQAAAFMWRMEGEPGGSPAHGFTDIVAAYQHDPVSWMRASNITNGTSATLYSPDRPLSRGELAALLYRLAGKPPVVSAGFPDVTAPWAVDAVAWMVDNGITKGTGPTTFSPDEFVTRGQLATFFYRYKGEPGVVVDPTHPLFPACADQIPVPLGAVGPGLTSDLPYGFAEGMTLMLDLYMPDNDDKGRAAIVVAHGRGGDKTSSSVAPLAADLAELGYVVVSINYRQFPVIVRNQDAVDAQHDMQAAVRWLRAEATDLGIAPDRIVVGGHSAGAAAAMWTVFSSDDPGSSGTPSQPSHVSGAFSMGGTGNPGLVDPGEPPILMLHGTSDLSVPVELAQFFCNAVLAAGNECEFVSFTGLGHSFTSVRGEVVAAVAAFVAAAT